MISYTITVCNEDEELKNLLDFLKDSISGEDEIVIQMDSMSVTSAVRAVVDQYRVSISNLNVIEFPLNKDFATFKNNLKNHCTKKWIFNIDADELPSETLISSIHDILNSNDDLEMILVPRWNTVSGITDEHIKRWGWQFDEHNRVNWPDYQTRIYKNTDSISWKNKVHERLSGYDRYSNLPAEEVFCLYHHKNIQKQEKQNEFYSEIQ
jgi:hypothetical protein